VVRRQGGCADTSINETRRFRKHAKPAKRVDASLLSTSLLGSIGVVSVRKRGFRVVFVSRISHGSEVSALCEHLTLSPGQLNGTANGDHNVSGAAAKAFSHAMLSLGSLPFIPHRVHDLVAAHPIANIATLNAAESSMSWTTLSDAKATPLCTIMQKRMSTKRLFVVERENKKHMVNMFGFGWCDNAQVGIESVCQG